MELIGVEIRGGRLHPRFHLLVRGFAACRQTLAARLHRLNRSLDSRVGLKL